jgi:hypothetical protein
MGSQPKDRANSLKSRALSFSIRWARRKMPLYLKLDEIFDRFGIPKLPHAKTTRALATRLIVLWTLVGIAIVAECRWIFSN